MYILTYAIILVSMFAALWFQDDVSVIDTVNTWMLASVVLLLFRFTLLNAWLNKRALRKPQADEFVLTARTNRKWFVKLRGEQFTHFDDVYGVAIISYAGALFSALCLSLFLGGIYFSLTPVQFLNFYPFAPVTLFAASLATLIMYLIVFIIKSKF